MASASARFARPIRWCRPQLVGEEYLVEIEAEALIGAGDAL